MKNICILIISLIICNTVFPFEGKATFYEIQPQGEIGSCNLKRNFNGVGLTVAINAAQYDGGSSCGKCVAIRAAGTGIGTQPFVGNFFATIDNICPECPFGNLDMGMAGDGIWDISWSFVPCTRNLRGNYTQ